MTTPTNHTTSSSLFEFGDLLQPSESSLDQNSSIDESTIFVSGMNEVSNHVHYTSSALGEDKENSNVANVASQRATTTALPATKDATTTTTTTTILPIEEPEKPPTGILKAPKYNTPQTQENLQVHTEYVIPLDAGSELDGNEPMRKQAFSPTVHTSNLKKSGLSPHVMSPTVKRTNRSGMEITQNNQVKAAAETTATAESAENATAWAIHLALIFFCALILACVLLTIKVVRNYGFLTLMLMMSVLLFCAFLAGFVDSTILSQNPKLKPVREAIVTVANATKKSIEEEYHLFIRDWKETMLMITENGEYAETLDSEMLPTTATTKKRKKSKVFAVIKPFLGLKKKLKKRRKAKNAETELVTSYEAPII